MKYYNEMKYKKKNKVLTKASQNFTQKNSCWFANANIKSPDGNYKRYVFTFISTYKHTMRIDIVHTKMAK